MNSRELITAVMRRQKAPRIPVMPQITHDVAVRLRSEADGIDWIEGVRRCLEDPARIYDYVIGLVRDIGADGLRLFVKPEPMKVVRDGDRLIALGAGTGDRIGFIDTHGGGYLVADKPVAPIETLAEARQRTEALARDFTDEKMATLAEARQRVADLFVVSSPGGMTMNTYTELRGRERALMDLYDRPDFVRAVIEMQTDAMIRRAERLLEAGIDALMIGDPSASGSLIGPRHFEQFCLPAYQRFCRQFRDRTLIYIHVCGNVNPILEMMAGCGVHAVEPLDPLGGVSVADARRRIGDRVALMGGVNTVTLAMGTPDEVRSEAIEKCRQGGPQGYILAAGDMVPPNTTFENLQTLVDVATKNLWR